jgi:hypothetical protein
LKYLKVSNASHKNINDKKIRAIKSTLSFIFLF